MLIAEASTRVGDFRNSLRAAVRGLWIGALDQAEFTDAFRTSLDRYLGFAWDEGAKAYGITPDDYTDDDRKVLADFILEQYSHVSGFAQDIKSQSKAKGGALDPLLGRVELWVNRYDELVSISRTLYGADEPQIWRLGKAEHCETCSALNGWVKRGSYWQQFYNETGIRPKSQSLLCAGYNCKCTLQPTRQPISKGRPPVVV